MPREFSARNRMPEEPFYCVRRRNILLHRSEIRMRRSNTGGGARIISPTTMWHIAYQKIFVHASRDDGHDAAQGVAVEEGVDRSVRAGRAASGRGRAPEPFDRWHLACQPCGGRIQSRARLFSDSPRSCRQNRAGSGQGARRPRGAVRLPFPRGRTAKRPPDERTIRPRTSIVGGGRTERRARPRRAQERRTSEETEMDRISSAPLGRRAAGISRRAAIPARPAARPSGTAGRTMYN